MPAVKVGGDIDARCSKCQLELAHVVVAMAGSRPVRVQCKTCGGVHAYRSSATGASRSRTVKTVARKRTVGSTSTKASEYERLMAGKDVSRAQRYRASIRFENGDVIDHPRFGIGATTRVLADDKVEVVFADGLKVLVHGRS